MNSLEMNNILLLKFSKKINNMREQYPQALCNQPKNVKLFNLPNFLVFNEFNWFKLFSNLKCVIVSISLGTT